MQQGLANIASAAGGALPTSESDIQAALRKKTRWGETVIQSFLFVCGAISILTTLGIVYVLGRESLLFFDVDFPKLSMNVDHLVEFFTNTKWQPAIEQFGIGPLVTATLMISLIALFFALRLGRGVAIYLSEYTSPRFRSIVKPVLILTALGIVYVLGRELLLFFDVDFSKPSMNVDRLVEFFTSTKWQPAIEQFGIWPLVTATLMTSLIALLFALPLGLGVAIYLSEYASPRFRSIVKPILEVLAGIPTVVYGYFALTFMTPFLRLIFGYGTVKIYNTASAGIVIGILILPLVSSMSEDALRAVPDALRQAALGLGATRFEAATRVIVPAALSGIAAAFIVATARAIGETMIVAIAAGAGPNFTFNPFDSAETMTGHIVRISGGDLSYDSVDYNSIFAIGLMLFFMTLGLNIISRRIVRRFREEYQ